MYNTTASSCSSYILSSSHSFLSHYDYNCGFNYQTLVAALRGPTQQNTGPSLGTVTNIANPLTLPYQPEDITKSSKFTKRISDAELPEKLKLCEKLEEDFPESFDSLMDKVRALVRGKLVGNRVRDSGKKSQTPFHKGRDQKEGSSYTKYKHTGEKHNDSYSSYKGKGSYSGRDVKKGGESGKEKNSDKSMEIEYVYMIRKRERRWRPRMFCLVPRAWG
ncbi:hypothetical protein QVD17_41707 [Tagetes erecta]|uniref:Uncharacterized protein n=1 Tax=Tagetes erecta TaxID=13708 RepID=A0AAD8N931_TARER|nr:hypothetical protein QVD17_41707 [Tagetes erecta]